MMGVLLRLPAKATCRVAKIGAGRRACAAELQPRGAGNRFRSDVNVAVMTNSGIGREPTKPHCKPH